ncbi:RICIN domain-containing protein [Streptomyces sp. NPDC127051]|uniref:RICIN domain-containing protein n=1 Tax=Streptomyces sp. NPDC127051 TaxID=3347119 RepID=UPI0036595C1C
MRRARRKGLETEPDRRATRVAAAILTPAVLSAMLTAGLPAGTAEAGAPHHPAPHPAQRAAQQECIPGSGYNRCRFFTYTGAVQDFTVPATKELDVRVWGAGGAGWQTDRSGGGGGFAGGTLPVTAGQQLRIVVGQGGQGRTGGWGGGGTGGNGTSKGGQGAGGGGMSGIWAPATSQALALAGGGGGAGSNRGGGGARTTSGGSGGGPDGGTGWSGTNGQGAEAGRGAAAATGGRGGTSHANGGDGGNAGSAGAPGRGDSPGAAGTLPIPSFGGSGGGGGYDYEGSTLYEGGGGGGAGYAGGGGGAVNNPTTIAAGGGGGSGFLASTVTNRRLTPGDGRDPAESGDPLRSDAGAGGGATDTNGSAGRVVLQWLEVLAPAITQPEEGAWETPKTARIGGSGMPGARVTVRDSSGTEVCQAGVTDSAWSCAPVPPLTPGPYALTATQTLDGVTSLPSTSRSFTVAASKVYEFTDRSLIGFSNGGRLALDAGNTADNTPVVVLGPGLPYHPSEVWTARGTWDAKDRLWTFVLRSKYAGKCLQPAAAPPARGTALVIRTCDGSEAQNWSVREERRQDTDTPWWVWRPAANIDAALTNIPTNPAGQNRTELQTSYPSADRLWKLAPAGGSWWQAPELP